MKFVIIYIYIVIFGGWVLKLLHFPSEEGLMIMQMFDYLPFLLIAIIFKVKRSSQVLPNTFLFWSIVLAFLLLSVFTTIYHNGSIFADIAHFGAMFRFAPLALLIYVLRPNEQDIHRFYKSFVILSIILLCIGYVEIIGGDSVKGIFIPLTQKYSSANKEELADINGIFPNTVDYSFFLIISYIIISNRMRSTHQVGLFFIYAVPLFFSGSKAALIIFLLSVSYRMNNARMKTIFISLVIIISVILIYKFWELFYWTVFINSQASRLGYIIFTFPCFLKEFSIDTLIGVSPDKLLAFHKINSYPNAPMMTWSLERMGNFEDEFYVALPIYYGLLGLGLIIILYCGMYRALINAHWIDKLFNYNIIVKSLFTTLLIAPLFNQIIIIKPFTVFFWCWIGIFLTRMRQKSVPDKAILSVKNNVIERGIKD